jgi:hypothetical protein
LLASQLTTFWLFIAGLNAVAPAPICGQQIGKIPT